MCELGEERGLCGWNCKHSYYAFVDGFSTRTYTDEQLEELEAKEQEQHEYKGKSYNAYQASQAQRQMETTMRAQRANIKNLKQGNADPDTVIAAQARYLNTLSQYKDFSKKMKLPEQMERVYMDGLGRVVTDNRIKGMFPQKMVDNMQKDLNQYKRYKEVLGESAGTLANFGKMKYNDSKKWELFQSYTKSVEKGMVSILSDFENYEKLHQEVEKTVIGIETVDGIKITEQSKHFMERIIGTMCDPKTNRPRSGVEVKEIRDALKVPILIKEPRISSDGKSSKKYIGRGATVSINPDIGRLIQCNPTDSDLVRKIDGNT